VRSMVPRRKFSSGPNGVVQAHSTVFVCSHCRRSGPCCSTNASAVMSDFISRWRLAAICALRGVALGGTQRNVRFARRAGTPRDREREVRERQKFQTSRSRTPLARCALTDPLTGGTWRAVK
jgi:hypothetical protein